jgi:glycosyltransferase involved in cell wall biosynthesis
MERQAKPSPELLVVGDLTGSSKELIQAIQDARAVATGFVRDLSDVLRPYDIHIVPWEFDTGTRTRIPLAMSYGQVVISTRNAAACLGELVSGENCILVENVAEMVDAITMLLQNPEKRIAIGMAARQTFLGAFTIQSQMPAFEKFMGSL